MQDWTYQTAEDIDQSVKDRLRRFPREPDLMVYTMRSAAACLIRTWMRAYHGLTIVGRENLPREGSCVLVANHTSHLDTLSVLSAFPIHMLHRVFPAAAKDFFFESLPRVAFSAVMVNALPFDRQTSIRQSLSLCRNLLDRPNTILLLFPEGTRAVSGVMGDFKPGIGYLLAGSDTPVCPCHIDGAFEALPKGAWLPRPKRIRVLIGEPRTYAHLNRGKESVRAICDELRESIQQLAKRKSRVADAVVNREDLT